MIDVVLPALNEASAVAWVVGRMPAGFRPILVDNGSTDATASIARAAGATVVHEPVEGFGSACWAGLQAATSRIVCFMDCDASLDPVALPLLVGYVEREEADLVIAERIARRGAWPPHARLANRVLTAEVRRRTGLPLTDLGPMRVIRRDTLLGLGMTDRRSGWPLEMVLRAAGAGLRVRSVPVEYRERAGRSKVTGTLRGTVRAVLDMSRMLRVGSTAIVAHDDTPGRHHGGKRPCT
ncbi:MAG: glycosyltransferase family 2 protein [Acidimicrobiia bacterium]|nr:glycosyltransferase family 2 protein [Acidimicrobiia bacterium]